MLLPTQKFSQALLTLSVKFVQIISVCFFIVNHFCNHLIVVQRYLVFPNLQAIFRIIHLISFIVIFSNMLSHFKTY